jgi:hypothetical protein
MKLATLKDKTRDGTLPVVSKLAELPNEIQAVQSNRSFDLETEIDTIDQAVVQAK